MKFTHILISIALSILIAAPGLAQQLHEDVVYLKNGTIVRGMIIQQIPNESITIRTKDGSQFVYRMNDVVQITREPLMRSSYIAEKNPPLALGLSCLLPGLGQFYNEQPGKGVVMLAGNLAGVVMMVAGTEDNYETVFGTVDPDDDDGTTVLGFIVWAGCLGWSMYDAYTAAAQINMGNREQPVLSWRPAAGRNAVGARLAYRF